MPPKNPRGGPQERTAPSQREQFMSLSVMLTGFNEAELSGTGMFDTYYALVPSIAGEHVFGELLLAWHRIASGGGGAKAREAQLRKQILGDPDLGPVARNVAYLWYTGSWNQLPGDWQRRNGASAADLTHVVSGKAYAEGLVWPAMGTHPQAAKQPGFASWSLEPEGA